ncbi:hypothetical protein FOMPIDRAFT_1047956 [Fomitopsis schrenkii]|uniref:Uncharacterized protein n=1 Tax=Fomitopsis schrenkii TaxID=2126942 RepID=S8ECD3_FOMSC|nr:hypothetical protein FOMPIDRAFT_1047956 [Fomitopsis schrenkii]
MFALAWAVAFLAASAQVMAVPIVSRCDEPQTCNATLPYNFTLAAYNPAQPAADPAPLYLTWGQPSHSSAGGYWVFATSVVDSPYASNIFPTFDLTTGYLNAEPAANVTQIVPWGITTNPGDVLSFVQAIGARYPAQIFCAGDESLEYPVLSINNNADGFSICPSIDDYDLDIVVYEPKQNSTFYTYDTCYPIRVVLVPA